MRAPNYKVFVYDSGDRYYDAIKVWGANAAHAVGKVKEQMIKANKDPMYYTYVAREESHVSKPR